jgi:alanyl-tRNA synthetase
MTHKDYLAEPQRLAGVATVLEVMAASPAIVRLDRTLFHAQGGGQKADRGRIGAARVTHVMHNGDIVDHQVEDLAGLEPGHAVELQVDADWRALNAAMHTAGHLLAGVVERLYPGLKAVAGHQWPGEGRVEFVGELRAEEISIDAINTALAADIADDLPVQVVGDPYSQRAIRIGTYSPIPCGGTHVAHLGQMASAAVRSVKAKGGKVRMGYEAAPAMG